MSPKELLRGEIKKHLNTVSGEEFLLQGAGAAALLCSSPVWLRYEAVFLFLSIKNSEIDTQSLLITALKEGKKAFAPRVEGSRLVFYPVLSADGPWRKGPFGLREPEVPPGEPNGEGPFKDFPALILTPGLAFDREGRRLGRGGGYYDRFFAELDEAHREYFALGLCMDFQVVDEVPTGAQDKKMNGLLTKTELRLFCDKS